MKFTVLVLVLQGFILNVLGECPHEDEELKRWSQAESWKENEVPLPGSSVEVDTAVLLDTSIDVHHVFIAKTGRLVLLPTVDIRIRARYILIHGALILGSENCTYHGNVTITLTGTRGDDLSARLPEFGEKFIGVEEGGVLEIHGQKRTSWSKVTQIGKLSTVRKNVEDRKLMTLLGKRNVNVMEFMYVVHVGREGNIIAQESLDLPANRRGGRNLWRYVRNKGAKLVKLAKSIPRKDLVAVVIKIRKSSPSEIRRLYKLLDLKSPRKRKLLKKNLLKNGLLVTLQQGSGHETDLIGFSLHLANAVIIRDIPLRVSKQRQCHLFFHLRFMVRDGLFITTDKSCVRNVSPKSVTMQNDNLGWKRGDRLLMTSTEVDWRQVEEMEVADMHGQRGRELFITEPIKYNHSTLYKEGVDARAEVMLLTRNIRIQGEMSGHCPPANENCGNCSRDQQPITGLCTGYNYDTFGAHVMMVKSFGRVVIQGVEFYNVGQQTQLGSYPIHFHLCGDVSGRAIIRHNSIHRSHSRCLTLHGTHNLTVEDVACYDHIGHGFFLEDGGELNNTFVRNLGVGTRAGNLTHSDDEPATFWLTSPLVSLRDNVAAGGDSVGFWFIFPNLPMGPSGNISEPVFKWGQAKFTPITEFDGNTAHSNAQTGLFVGNSFNNETYTTACTSQYSPRVDPLDEKSEPKRVVLANYTGFKNGRHNAWVVGGAVTLLRASLADSPVGVFYNERGEGVPSLEKSIIVGKLIDNDKIKYRGQYEQSLRGITFNGRLRVDGVYLNWFPGKSSGAVSFLTNVLRTGAEFSNVTYGYTFFVRKPYDNRMYFKQTNRGRTALVRDIDGTLTGWQDSIATNLRWQGDRLMACKNKEKWQMAVCPAGNDLAMLFWKFRNGFTVARQQLSTRSLAASHDVITHVGGGKEGSYVLVQNGSYALDYWTTTIRPELRYSMKAFLLEVSNLKAGDYLNLALCLSYQNVSVELSKNFQMVESREDLEHMTTDAAYQDDRLGIMFIRFYASHDQFRTRKLTVNLYFPPEGNNFHADCRRYTEDILHEPPKIKPKLRRRRRRNNLLGVQYSWEAPKSYGAGRMKI